MQSGSVEILCAHQGEELHLDFQEQGSYFGEVALLLDGRPREASVRAVTFCNMFSFSKDSLNFLLGLYPEVVGACPKDRGRPGRLCGGRHGWPPRGPHLNGV